MANTLRRRRGQQAALSAPDNTSEEPTVEDVVTYTTLSSVPYHRDDAQPTFPGGQGSVFKASKTFATSRFRREVKTFAIKEISVKDKRARQRLWKEIEHLRRCKHQNVLDLVEVYIVDQQEWADRTFLVTHPWAQASLERLLVSIANSEDGTSTLCPWYKPQDTSPWPSIVRQCILGLEHLHNNKIRHKDLKPDNILLVDESDATSLEPKVRAIIADLGISKDYVEAEGTTFGGTYQYLAPEQEARVSSTYHSDIFSLGCCISFIHALLSSKPWELCHGDEFGLFQLEELIAVGFSKVSEAILPLLKELRDDDSSRPQDVADFLLTLEDIITSALVKEPFQRGDLGSFLVKLDAYDGSWIRTETIKILDLCITYGYRTKVVPIDFSKVKTDQEALDTIKHHYSKHFSYNSLDWLRSLTEVKVIEFPSPCPSGAHTLRHNTPVQVNPTDRISSAFLVHMISAPSFFPAIVSTAFLERLPTRRQTIHYHRDGSQTISNDPNLPLGLHIVMVINIRLLDITQFIVMILSFGLSFYHKIHSAQIPQDASLPWYVVCGLLSTFAMAKRINDLTLIIIVLALMSLLFGLSFYQMVRSAQDLQHASCP